MTHTWVHEEVDAVTANDEKGRLPPVYTPDGDLGVDHQKTSFCILATSSRKLSFKASIELGVFLYTLPFR